MKCAECADLVRDLRPVSGAWMKVRFGHDGQEHWAHRGTISAAVDAAPHFLTICGLSLGDMIPLEPKSEK